MQAELQYNYIRLSDEGDAIIAGTTLKVKELVAERLAWGWSPEELLLNHPYLTLGQIYAALAYYADHQDEMEEAIEADLAFIMKQREEAPLSPLLTRLRAQRRR